MTPHSQVRADLARKGQSICLALATLAVSPALVRAQEPDPIDAILTACLAPDLTAAVRLDLLAASGWRTAEDTTAIRALLAMQHSLRFPKADDSLRDAVIQGAATPADLSDPPDQTLTVDDLAELASATMLEWVLSDPDNSGLVRLRVLVGKDQADLLAIDCNLVVTAPQGDNRLADLPKIAVLLDPDQTKQDDATPGMTTLAARRTADADHSMLRLFAGELQPDAPHNQVFRDAGLPMTLSLFLTSTQAGLTLR